MNNIFDTLRESHEKQRLLLDALLSTTGDSSTRREFYAELKQELQQHAIAEERYFYAPLIEEDKTIEMSRHGIAEHHAIDKIIAQLDETDYIPMLLQNALSGASSDTRARHNMR